MIIHTLLYRFDTSVSAETVDEFLEGLREVATNSGLIESFGSGKHHRLPVDEKSAGTVGHAIAQFACEDLATLRSFSERTDVHSFLARWRERISYDAVYLNHDELLERTAP